MDSPALLNGKSLFSILCDGDTVKCNAVDDVVLLAV